MKDGYLDVNQLVCFAISHCWATDEQRADHLTQLAYFGIRNNPIADLQTIK